MELNFKETNVFCHQLVEIEGRKFILDASTMKPKSYYWGVPTEEISVEMLELKDDNLKLETPVNKIGTMTVAMMVQPFVGLLYLTLKNFFQDASISQNLLFKSALFLGTMFISYTLFRYLLYRARKRVIREIGISNRKYQLLFKPKETRKQIFDAYMLNMIVVVCFVSYLFIDNGTEGILLIVAGIITLFLIVLEFGKVPILSAYKLGNISLENIRKTI